MAESLMERWRQERAIHGHDGSREPSRQSTPSDIQRELARQSMTSASGARKFLSS